MGPRALMPFGRWRCWGVADTIQATQQSRRHRPSQDGSGRGWGKAGQTAALPGGNDHDHALLRLLRQALRPHVRPRSGALLLLPGLPASDGGPPTRLERQNGHPADRRAAGGGAGPLRPPPHHSGRTASRSLLEVKRTAPRISGKTAVRRGKSGGKMELAPLAADRGRPHLVAVTLVPCGAGVQPVDCTHLDRRSPAPSCSTCSPTRMPGPAF